MNFAPLALGAILAVAAQPALALGVGYTLVIDGSTNVPTFTLTNDSDSAQITGFSFTVGDAGGYNFDYVNGFTYSPGSGMSASLVTGDPDNGGARTDLFVISYVGFDPLEEFSFVTDVDPDGGNATVNYNDVFWSNGASDNSAMEVTFSTGEVLSQVAPNPAAVLSSYSFSQSSATAVPIPATLPLLGAGLALGGLLLRRRQG